eukprot:gnl/Hemi2/25305_TR8518_c0_g2_i1.p3 gnl/Hemi2/25305_TR8518_c0_g2~~gnl/Hemi2/25305_TR8518_c0_g2_i1.p3  ORF type:complete len:199 (+),score=10.40 gnl/Hemi2/25305_TR8518_c0_g2_i1:59-655(+)
MKKNALNHHTLPPALRVGPHGALRLLGLLPLRSLQARSLAGPRQSVRVLGCPRLGRSPPWGWLAQPTGGTVATLRPSPACHSTTAFHRNAPHSTAIRRFFATTLLLLQFLCVLDPHHHDGRHSLFVGGARHPPQGVCTSHVPSDGLVVAIREPAAKVVCCACQRAGGAIRGCCAAEDQNQLPLQQQNCMDSVRVPIRG